MIVKINKIRLLPSTKIFTGILAFVGLIDGIFYLFGSVEFEFDQQERNPSLFKSALF